jgi:hypothetical protein
VIIKIPRGSPTSSEIYANYHQDFAAANTATSSKDRWIGAYSIGLTIPWKLGCPIRKKKRSIM